MLTENTLTESEKKDWISRIINDTSKTLFSLSNATVRSDRDVAKAAVVFMSANMQYASEALRKDRKFIEELLVEYYDTVTESCTIEGILDYVHPSILDNEQFMLRLIYLGLKTIQYASERLRKDKKFIKKAIKAVKPSFVELGLIWIAMPQNKDKDMDLDVIRAFYEKSNSHYFYIKDVSHSLSKEDALKFERELQRNPLPKKSRLLELADILATIEDKNPNENLPKELRLALEHNLTFSTREDLNIIMEACEENESHDELVACLDNALLKSLLHVNSGVKTVKTRKQLKV